MVEPHDVQQMQQTLNVFFMWMAQALAWWQVVGGGLSVVDATAYAWQKTWARWVRVFV